MPIFLRVPGVGGVYPVARIGDDHSCHKMTETGPHVGGKVMTGANFVTDQGKPIACVGDKLHCHPVHDRIKAGIDNIRINGKPIAIAGSDCDHGGVITEGSDLVFVADPLPLPDYMPKSPLDIPRPHWVQAQLQDAAPGTPWTLTDSLGNQYSGRVNEQGYTGCIEQVPAGPVTVYFGPRAELNQQLVQYRAELKRRLDNILRSTIRQNNVQEHRTPPPKGFLDYFTYNAALNSYFFAGCAEGFALGLLHGISTIVHLFLRVCYDVSQADLARHASLSGDEKALAMVQQHFVDEGSRFTHRVNKARMLLSVVCQDPETRQILLDFVSQYIHGQTPVVLSKQLGEIVGGLSVAVLIALILKDPSAVAESIVDVVTSEINAVSEVLTKIAETITKRNKTAEIETSQLDQVHVTELTPPKLAEGAMPVELARQFYAKPSKEISHFFGESYNLAAEDVLNFSGDVVDRVLPPGTKLYRVIEKDNPSTPVNGRYWSYELPEDKASWRSGYAVKAAWNKNGYYVEYTVGDEGLAVWEGKVSSQDFNIEGEPGWLLEGGNMQVFVPQAKEEIPMDLPLKRTDWSE